MEQCFDYQELTRQETEALKALNKGEADEGQQRLALYAIVNKLCRAHDVLYIPGSHDRSAFLSGRGFVGAKILKYINIPVGQLEGLEDDR